jgi:AraC-like DNA-binding protein
MAIRPGVPALASDIADFAEQPKVQHLARHVMKRVCMPSRYAVRAAIAASLRHGDARLVCTARQLGLSTRSLQRRLADMGTSYSELVAEVRLDTACHLLVDSDERIADIAARLGFAGPSSFSRTFMRLMKVQPVVYRRQQSALNGGAAIRRRKQPAQHDEPP